MPYVIPDATIKYFFPTIAFENALVHVNDVRVQLAKSALFLKGTGVSAPLGR